jgi:hypothetical protein
MRFSFKRGRGDMNGRDMNIGSKHRITRAAARHDGRDGAEILEPSFGARLWRQNSLARSRRSVLLQAAVRFACHCFVMITVAEVIVAVCRQFFIYLFPQVQRGPDGAAREGSLFCQVIKRRFY